MINDLFDVFLSAECQKIYKPLVYLNTDKLTGKVEGIQKEKQEAKLSISLGQVVQLCIHFAQALNITLLHHMVYNGKKSMIYHKPVLHNLRAAASEAAVPDELLRSPLIAGGYSSSGRLTAYRLHITEKDRGQYEELSKALGFLADNLKDIYHGLRSLREYEGIGSAGMNQSSANLDSSVTLNQGNLQDEYEQNSAFYPNMIIYYLHKIAAFQ